MRSSSVLKDLKIKINLAITDLLGFYSENTADLPKYSRVKRIQDLTAEYQSLIQKTYTDIETLQNEKISTLDEKFKLLSEKEVIQEALESKINLIEKQKLFMKRLLFVYPELSNKVSQEELVSMFGEDILNVGLKKYNPYRKIA